MVRRQPGRRKAHARRLRQEVPPELGCDDRFPLPSGRREFAADLERCGRARAAGVTGAACILAAGRRGTRASGPRATVAGGVVRARIHPHHAGAFAQRLESAAETVARGVKVAQDACAVGEIGSTIITTSRAATSSRRCSRSRCDSPARGASGRHTYREATEDTFGFCEKLAKARFAACSTVLPATAPWLERQSRSGFMSRFQES